MKRNKISFAVSKSFVNKPSYINISILTPFKTFSATDFDRISKQLYCGDDSLSITIKSLQDKNFARILDCIDEYIALGKEQYYLRNRKRAYRIYVSIVLIIQKLLKTIF